VVGDGLIGADTGLQAVPDMLVRLSRVPVVSIASIRGRATGVGSERRDAETKTSSKGTKYLKLNARVGDGDAQSLFTLVVTEEWFASANFRETELGHIAVGSCAVAYSLVDRWVPYQGQS
jgi:membrane fusion protein, multidrug efflux system